MIWKDTKGSIMAKRRGRSRKQDSSSATLIILQVAVALVVVITPIILLLGSLFFGLKRRGYTKYVQGNLSDFWLDDDEKQEFKEVSKILDDAHNAIADAKTTGRIKNVSVNKDGSFSARSKLGKELREIIEENEMIIGRYDESHTQMVNLPQTRWKNFRNTFAASRSFISGLFIWIILAGVAPAVLIQNDTVNYIEGIRIFFYFPVMLLKQGASGISANVWQMMAIVTGGSVLVAAVVAIISLFSVKSITPYPPKVTEKNIDEY